jgi:hypothetical protein
MADMERILKCFMPTRDSKQIIKRDSIQMRSTAMLASNLCIITAYRRHILPLKSKRKKEEKEIAMYVSQASKEGYDMID